MTEILTSAQMRAIEQAAIDSGQVTGLQLMERAGQGVVAAISARWPESCGTSRQATVLCGPGNNGGDGYVIGRLLYTMGWRVSFVTLAPPDTRAPDALVNYRKARKLGCAFETLLHPDARGCRAEASEDLVIDALFGTGLARGLSRAVSEGLASFARNRVVAVDIPSGLCADTGQVLGAHRGAQVLGADMTITFHALKHGHVKGQGPGLCGQIICVDIGVGPWDAARHDA